MSNYANSRVVLQFKYRVCCGDPDKSVQNLTQDLVSLQESGDTSIVDMGDYEDEYSENVPTHFYDTKWPHPKLKRNRPTGKDEALVWFMDYYQDDIAEHMKKLNKRKRY